MTLGFNFTYSDCRIKNSVYVGRFKLYYEDNKDYRYLYPVYNGEIHSGSQKVPQEIDKMINNVKPKYFCPTGNQYRGAGQNRECCLVIERGKFIPTRNETINETTLHLI